MKRKEAERSVLSAWYDEAVGMGLEMGLTSLRGALGLRSLVRSCSPRGRYESASRLLSHEEEAALNTGHHTMSSRGRTIRC